MRLTLVTGPSSEPLTATEAKNHLRVDVSDEDAQISSWIVAARKYVEQLTGRALMPQTWDVLFDDFACDQIWLPKAPVSAITHVKYYATNGTLTTLSSDAYLSELPAGDDAGLARIEPIYGTSWPIVQCRMSAVQVRIVCGYANAAAVPDGLKAAMKLLIGHWYANRESVVTGTISTEVQIGVTALIYPFKVIL